ncbi:MAG: carbohydrate ABC transporter permease, partial [Lachnospiraceae bacterium]|nr:carbohydrate ABC transporter permease [Lachnospiraceae bacterium]
MLYFSKPVKVILNVLTVLFCVIYLFPIYLILTNSFKSRSEMYENMVALPGSLSLQYYASALEKMNFFTSLKNSLILTIVSIAIIVIFASMTAWMFVRSKNKLSVILFDILVATMLIPFQTIMMPLMQEMNWIGNNLGIKMT